MPVLIIFIGTTIRIILLPLAAHGDTWSALRGEYYWINFGIFRLNQFPEVLQAVYLRLIDAPILQSALPSLFDTFFPIQGLGGDVQTKLVANPMAMRVLFFYKLPYLLFDMGCVFVLFKIFTQKRNRIIAALLWALNPLVLHSVYMWGRYEIFSILFVLVAFYYAKENKAFWSVLLFGLAVAFRMPFILVLPLLIIYFSDNWKDGLKYTVLGLLPLFMVNQLMSFLGPDTSVYYKSVGFFNFFASTGLVGDFAPVGINYLVYPVIICLFLNEKRKGIGFVKLVYFAFTIFLTTFSFSYFHPQYAAWLTPFLLIAVTLNRKLIIPSIISLILLYLLINYGLGETTGLGLFLPSSAIISHLPKFEVLPFDNQMNTTVVYNLFIIVNMYLIVMMYKDKDRKNSEV